MQVPWHHRREHEFRKGETIVPNRLRCPSDIGGKAYIMSAVDLRVLMSGATALLRRAIGPRSKRTSLVFCRSSEIEHVLALPRSTQSSQYGKQEDRTYDTCPTFEHDRS